jgi:HEAT repeat protein
MRPLAFLILGLTSVMLVFLVVLMIRRSWLVRRQRRRDALVRDLRPAALSLVEDNAHPPALRGFEAEVFAELLGGYARLVRGESHDRITAYFEATGAVEEQREHLSSRRAWRRASAAFALGDMGSPRAVPWLLRGLDDKSRDVRMAAARSLGRIGAIEAIQPLIEAGVDRRVPRDVVGLALFDIGPAAVPSLLELTGHQEPKVRANAVELVGFLGDPGEAGSLSEGLHDAAAPVRAATAGALGRLGAAAARDALVNALDDRVPSVRVAAARALGQIGGRRALEALLQVARTDEFEPARVAAGSAARIDPAAVVHTAEAPDAGPHLREAADLVGL